jgi:hypothetical protein
MMLTDKPIFTPRPLEGFTLRGWRIVQVGDTRFELVRAEDPTVMAAGSLGAVEAARRLLSDYSA